MAGAVQKELKKVHRELERQGWEVVATGGGHWQYRAPDGVSITAVPRQVIDGPWTT